MKIFEIIKDITDDVEIREARIQDAEHISRSWRNSHSKSAGFFLTILPNIVGFIVGCAAARLFVLPDIFYIIFGIIFAVAGGTYFSVAKEGISLKYAIIRHCIIVGFIIAIFILGVVMNNDK